MKITADTNLLVRAIVLDDVRQTEAAEHELDKAALVALTLPALCEFGWVLSSNYRLAPADIATSIRKLLEASNVAADHIAINAGLQMLDAGGDFADGVIAAAGKSLGAEAFVSFDKKAVRLLRANGEAARPPK
ncbi:MULTISPECIES: type II toxin-antitoxin system VapC family toxin [Sphingobium]|uniref:PilT-like protein n=1 Tax=Sphingobium indicum (strain DSM 16413 / CCM 7287 / MTCC 6362 / UT26 / NBRC 101211 / UT26S) TaxID=452662 RepID=D4Z8Y9_SPHIU|nr:type II toxin-antitoxin system VapC family toxin [Sphingobium indicum]BAI99071.1 PilT-like protein [Sphingobium indicum UT26S]